MPMKIDDFAAGNKDKNNSSYLFPRSRNTSIEHVVQSISQILAHDDSTVDSQLQILQRCADARNDALHAVNLLPQEDVDWLEMTHLTQPFFHLSTNDITVKFCIRSIIF